MLALLNNNDSIREGKYIGERIGKIEEKVNSIKSLNQRGNFSTEQSMNLLGIPIEEQSLYYKLVNDPIFYEEYFADESNFLDSFDDEDEDDDEE